MWFVLGRRIRGPIITRPKRLRMPMASAGRDKFGTYDGVLLRVELTIFLTMC